MENLTEKQRSIVEQSNASQKPRIAKLKALFERNPGMRESRSSHAKQRSCPVVARSHSLGAMRIKAEGQEEHLVMAAGNSVRPVRHLNTATTVVHTQHFSPVQPSTLTVRPSLPVKRSKSLKVLGSSQRCKLSLATNITTASTSEDSSDSQAASSTPTENVPVHMEEGATNMKPFIPPKKHASKRLDISVKMIKSDSIKSPKKTVDDKCQKSLDWMNSENSHVVPKRRRSLESVNFENVATPSETHKLISLPKKCESLDEEARRILEDCKDYLFSDEQHNRVVRPQVSSDVVTLEAQRKVNAIVAGLGIRERRNSFRQAVGTGQEGEGKSSRKFKDYEAIWPCGSPITTSLQIQGSHPSTSYMNVATDSTSVPASLAHLCKAKPSTWFHRSDERKIVPSANITVNSETSSLEQGPSANHHISVSGSVRTGKLGIHPKPLSRSKPMILERRVPRSNILGNDHAFPIFSSPMVNPPNLVKSPPHSEMITQTTKPSALWLRKSKSSTDQGAAELRNHLRKDGSFYNVTEHERRSPWVGKTMVNKVQTQDIPQKSTSPLACNTKPQVPTNEHDSPLCVTKVPYKPSPSTGNPGISTASSQTSVVQVKKPSTSQEISYGK